MAGLAKAQAPIRLEAMRNVAFAEAEESGGKAVPSEDGCGEFQELANRIAPPYAQRQLSMQKSLSPSPPPSDWGVSCLYRALGRCCIDMIGDSRGQGCISQCCGRVLRQESKTLTCLLLLGLQPGPESQTWQLGGCDV
ncbi:hypothetical protein NQZ68_011376 [Dissostichus eleginoides]|nr:hypothetical protein NQZ68_011376 [Dissostichus eleginoides]